MLTLTLILLCLGPASYLVDASLSYGVRQYGGSLTKEERAEMCSAPLSGPEWVFSQKKDYGWGEQTHRALIVLALNKYKQASGNEDIKLLQHQLEVEFTRALLRNKTQPMHVSDLALYIHALIITERDPRNFHGLDLVEILKGRVADECAVKTTDDVNAFALLVLSDCMAIDKKQVEKLKEILLSEGESRKQKEMKALALHALACALDDGQFSDYASVVDSAADTLALWQKSDGSFGNVYTTALVVQALSAAQYRRWDEPQARQFLIRKSVENVNIVSTYYIERALKANEVKCFKSFYQRPRSEDGLVPVKELQRLPGERYVRYTLRTSEYPKVYFTATTYIPKSMNFFDIMRLVEEEDSTFRFSWYLDELGQPVIYSISGLPNDAEESLYWRLTEEYRAKNGTQIKVEHTKSPRLVIPEEGSHMTYLYIDAFKQHGNNN